MLNIFLAILNVIGVSTQSYFCTEYDYYNYWNNYFTIQTVEPTINNTAHALKEYSATSQKLGVGFWMNYRPFMDVFLKVNPKAQYHTDQDQMFVFSFKFNEQDEDVVYIYVEMLHTDQKIFYHMLFQTNQGWQHKTLLIDYQTYENDWVLVYWFADLDQEQISMYLYSYKLNTYQEETISGKLKLNSYMESITGGYQDIDIPNLKIYLQAYPGLIYGVFIDSYNIFDDFETFLQDCQVFIYSYDHYLMLINNNQYMTNPISKHSYFSIHYNQYLLQGWIKQDALLYKQYQASLLLRVTTNEQYLDNNQIGDRVLYIVYNQNNIVLQENGFTLQTYSYTFPYKPAQYSSNDHIIQVNDAKYEKLLTEWHYFQFEIGTLNNDGQPLYRVNFPTADLIEQFQWSTPINHFTNDVLYFHIGGDDFHPNPFKGYLSNWKFQYFRQKSAPDFRIFCYYTCKTCMGVSSNECLSCPDNSFRLYSSDMHTCTCQHGYLDIENQSICQELHDHNLIYSMVEIEVINNKYYSDIVSCDFGYFKYQDVCIQCPHGDTNYLIACADCYINPEKFSQNLLCTFKFISQEDSGIFNNELSDSELYKISLNSESKYELVLIKGAKADGSCKDGYFVDSKGECKACKSNCLSCSNEYTCQECQTNYKETKDQNCVSCEMCKRCDNYGGIESCYSEMFCSSTQYWDNQGCFDCGNNCASCTKTQCLFCTDPVNYFITLDNIHCERCNILNCKYCFQYVYLNDDSLVISLDIRSQGIDLSISEIRTGCALCQNNLFYSFETGQCTSPTIQNCDFGVITDTQSICVKSQTLQYSIQQSNCSEEQCLSCINNYSPQISSFCIICMDGYYSSYLTGQCFKCIDCQTCAQQNINYSDYWKWDIRGFYYVFANRNRNHYFEFNVVSSNLNNYNSVFEIVCLSCPKNQLLFKGKCYDGCNSDCLDCQIVTITDEKFLSVPTYKAKCFKCKSTPYNLQRSAYPENNCLNCPNYCAACYPRTEAQIKELNPFFNQKSSYLKYSHICFEQGELNVLPKYMVPIICNEYEKCTKKLTLTYWVYCDSKYLNIEGEQDERKSYTLYIFGFGNLLAAETNQLKQYMNEVRITEVEYLLDLIYYPKSNKCRMVYSLGFTLKNQLHESVFALNKITLVLFASSSVKAPAIFGQDLIFLNFEVIKFQNLQFLMPERSQLHQSKYYTNISINNDYYPIVIEFQDCEFFQTDQKVNHLYIFSSNRPQKLTMNQVILNGLRIQHSAMFDFQPNKIESPTQTISNLRIVNSQFTNTSVFQYDTTQGSLNYLVKFKDVTIVDSYFSSSYFINSTSVNEYSLGEIYMENLYLENLIFQNNSQFFQVLSANNIQFKNITIKNSQFLDTSSLFISNILKFEGLQILDSIINSGYFITNLGNFSQSSSLLSNSKSITLQQIKFKGNNYSDHNSFIYILQNQIDGINMQLINLIIENNCFYNSQIGKSSYSYASYKDVLIFIECTYCLLKNVQVNRGLGYPEISILNSQDLKIESLQIQLNSRYYFRSLHTSFNCAKQFIYLDLPFVLYIGSYIQILFDDLIIGESIIIDYPFIILKGISQTDQIQKASVTFQNSNFHDNLLLKTITSRFTSIISIDSDQSTIILINNTNFVNNHLNSYQEDIQLRSSSTFLISVEQGQVTIIQSNFTQNVVTNSSETILYIKAATLNIKDVNFANQNMLNAKVLQKNIILVQNQMNQNIFDNFLILSNGGNGNFFISQLFLDNVQVSNSIAVNGAGFYVITQSEGIIKIKNSYFKNTSTILNDYQFTQGGLLYIESSKSQLYLTIQNSSISQSYSRTLGGVIFIEPSRLKTLINLSNLFVEAVFSLQHLFLSFSPSKFISVSSEVYIYNSTFYNNNSEFEIYFSKINDLQEQNIQLFQRANPLIYVQYSNFSMLNCSFQMHLANIIQIEQGININLLSLKIFNSSILQSPLIKLNLRTDLVGSIKIKNVEIIEIRKFVFSQSPVCNEFTTEIFDLLCPLVFSDISTAPLVDIQQDQTNQLECNLQKLYQTTNYNFSLIEITNLQTYHYIFIQDVHNSQIDCSVCHYGIISIQEFTQLNMQINKLYMENNICGGVGCLSIIQSITNTTTNDINVNTSIEKNFTATITNSQFISNTAMFGGACFFSNVNLLINNSLFTNNDAQKSGGAVYYISNETQILFMNSQIVNNTANVAGGVYLNENQLQKTQELNLFIFNNSAVQSANNVFEAPRYLLVSLNNIRNQKNRNIISNASTIIDQVLINPYFIYGSSQKTDIFMVPTGISLSQYQYFDPRSNSYIPYNLTLRITAYNLFGEQIVDLENTKCTIEAQVINSSIVNKELNGINSSYFISQTSVVFDPEIQGYNLDDLVIYFNPFNDKELNLQLAFKCDAVEIPYYDSTSITKPVRIINNYILLLNLRTFQCQLGEYFNETSGGCVLCDITQQQYSVSLNATKCTQKDEVKIKKILPAMIELKPNYWRAYYYSEIIESCHNLLANCEGGWFAGNPSCAIGHIGALCEQCDLYDIKGQGEYSQNQSYQCSSCDESASNILNIILVVCWTLISVFITVTSTIKMIEDLVFSIKLKPLGFYTVIQSASTSVLLKVFTNYLQIISSISSFQLTIPIGLTLAVRGVGNPIESMAFSLDCYLKSVSSISIIYFRIIWGFVMVGIYIFLFFSAHILITLLKQGKLNITFITTTFIYIYIYLSPNLVSGLSLLISYRNISNQKWIAANVAYLYNTEQHKNWLLYFVTPAFFIIGILLPFFFWYILYHHRSQLHLTKIKKVWGYLYNEYKLTQYYWETIKIIQKELIILVLIYYEDYVTIKACLIFFLLHIYSKLTTKYKPYQTSKLNLIDSLSNSICKISIILAQSIYSAQILGFIEIIWPFYTVLAIINIFFIIQMLQKIMFAYFEKLADQLDNLKGIISYTFPKIISKNRFLQQIMRNSKERQQIVRKRFQRLRIYLLQQAKIIMDFKKSNNMGLSIKEEYQEYQRNKTNIKLNTILKASPTLKLCDTVV